jgi:hypothetical protein
MIREVNESYADAIEAMYDKESPTSGAVSATVRT